MMLNDLVPQCVILTRDEWQPWEDEADDETLMTLFYDRIRRRG